MELEIILQVSSSYGWAAAQYIDGKPDPTLVDLFGTHILPLPYTSQAPAEFVLKNVTEQNKDAKIVFADVPEQPEQDARLLA